MDIKDIITLAKAGYKPSEVKELITLATQSEAPQEGETDQAEKTEQHDGGEEQPQEALKNATDAPDQSSEILSYKQKIEDLENRIRELQNDKVHQDVSDKNEKSDEELMADLVRDFM